MSKIRVGYGSGTPLGNGKAAYGKRRSGKHVVEGFSGQPTVGFLDIDQEKWDKIFGKKDDSQTDGEKA